MAKGILISVTDNQEGENPQVVTADTPLPVSMDTVKVEQSASIIASNAALKDSIDLMNLNLIKINKYLSIGFDFEVE